MFAAERHTQRVAALLFVWLTLGWLAPTFLLLPPTNSEPEPHQEPDAAIHGQGEDHQPADNLSLSSLSTTGREGSHGQPALTQHTGRRLLQLPRFNVVHWLERALRQLKYVPPAYGDCEPWPCAALQRGLRWLITLTSVWQVCCLAAPLYGTPA